jgi:hypothetical protein
MASIDRSPASAFILTARDKIIVRGDEYGLDPAACADHGLFSRSPTRNVPVPSDHSIEELMTADEMAVICDFYDTPS